MGSLEGHLVPGTVFILLSMWWYIKIVFSCVKRKKEALVKSRISDNALIPANHRVHLWFPCRLKSRQLPVEPVAKTVLALFGAALELLYENQYRLLDPKGNFVQSHLNNYAHATMFSIFALSGAVDLTDHYSLLPLPRGMCHVVLSWAFFVEGLLFYNHLHGRPSLDVHVHTFIYLIAFATAVVILLELLIASPLPLILRAYLTTIHGTWFYQVGFVLHGRRPWENIEANVEFITIALVWHMVSIFILYTAIYAIINRVISKRMKKIVLKSSILESESESEYESK